MGIEQIVVCLEQKEILLTKIMDLTKQIEVRCRQETIVLDDLFAQRDVYMARVDKCERLNASLILQLPGEYQERLKLLLQAKDDKPPYTEEEREILRLAGNCLNIKRKAMSFDQSANELVKKRRNEIKEKLNESFKMSNNLSMFHQK